MSYLSDGDEKMDMGTGDVLMVDEEIKGESKFPYEFLKKSIKADRRTLIDVTKEYGLLLYYDDYDSRNKILKLFRLIAGAVADNQFDFLSLGDIKNSFDQYFKYLELKRKYDKLVIKAGSILDIDYQGFHVNEFIFETLDEVEKALSNKMFL